MIDGHSVYLGEESGLARDQRPVTFDVFPDDVLTEIIFFYVNTRKRNSKDNPWHILASVCRRWRYVVFASPRYLDLRLEYRGHGPMSEVPDAWPVLPLILKSPRDEHGPRSEQRWDNIVAVLESEHYNRICGIDITDSRFMAKTH